MLTLVGILIVAGVLYGALLALGLGRPPTQMELLRLMPEADLLYPGSEVIADGGGDAEWTILGGNSAVAWQYVGVNATPQEIEAWYALELAGRGWVEGGGSSGLRSTAEMSTQAWEKDGIIFRLGIRDPNSWRANPEQFERYESVYDVRLRSDD